MIDCRPCVVNEKEALFHRWVDSEKLYLHLDCVVRNDEMDRIMGKFRADQVIPKEVTPSIVKATLGLVEFWDGTVDLVGPKDIRFLDSTGIFSEYCTLKGLN